MIDTEIVRVDPLKPDPGHIRRAAAVLEKGGIIIYPTETFYGLGGLCSSAASLRRIFELKRRGAGKPLPVIVSDEAMAREIAAEVPQAFEVLSREFWPGPLTLVLKAKPIFPGELYGPGQTIGLRVPAAVWARELVCFLKIPITATSANLSGRKEVSDPAEIQRLFGGLVDLIIDGGKTSGGRPSTVIDLTASEFKILREGAIRRVDIQKALGRLT